VYDFCTEKVKSILRVNRENEDKEYTAAMALKRAKLSSDETSTTTTNNNNNNNTIVEKDVVKMDVEKAVVFENNKNSNNNEEEDALNEAIQLSLLDNNNNEKVFNNEQKQTKAINTKHTSSTTSLLGEHLPDNFTGLYELYGVVTHKGRSADSGHYIGWVRQQPSSDFWWCYDDDKVTEVRTEDIIKLKGGGDWHMNYLNFYRFKENNQKKE
jgi:hypothetical protein